MFTGSFSSCKLSAKISKSVLQSRKKIDREINEVFKKINETSLVLNKSNNDDGDSDRFITEK